MTAIADATPLAGVRPRLSQLAIMNMCLGFFGIQIGFALQNGNASRIFQTLGAQVDNLAILWIAAPLTGLLVQPVIGHFSDRTWGPLGRRRPYFLVGAILTSAAMVFMPNAPTLWLAAATLWVMDASINVTMEPFRAFVGDNLPDEQRTAGYATQTFFIGAGAVLASCLPWILSNVFHVVSTAPAGRDAGLGQTGLLHRRCRHASGRALDHRHDEGIQPRQIDAFETTRGLALTDQGDDRQAPARSSRDLCGRRSGLDAGRRRRPRMVSGAGLEKELYVLAGFVAGFGLLQMARRPHARRPPSPTA
jgi:maltose/moltooligosaccharide transporter